MRQLRDHHFRDVAVQWPVLLRVLLESLDTQAGLRQTHAASVHCRSYALSGSLSAAWSNPDAAKSRFARGSLQNSRPIGPCLMRSPLVTPVQAFNVPRNRARYPCSKKTFNFLRALRLTRFVRRSKPRHPTYELHYPSFFAASPRDAVSQTTYIQCPLFPYRP